MTASEGPYHQIVVGTDGSASARGAVRHAAELAAATGARLTVVSAYTRREQLEAEREIGSSDPWIVTDAAAAQAHVGEAQDWARSIGLSDLGGRADPGDPAGVLLDVATEIAADVIVVGSKGMASASRFVLGSVPNRVSHHATCDVIIARTAD